MTPSEATFTADALRGRVALISGGGTGIGRATALSMAAAGADLVLTGRRQAFLEETARLARGHGATTVVVPADLRNPDEATAVVDAACAELGRIDILVNNAGGQFQAAAEDISTTGWRAVHRLSVEAVWHLTREVATRSMIPQRGGVLLFLAFSPRRGIPGMVHATSARAAIENLASGLSLEWSRYGIRSVAVAPGTILTSGLEQYAADARREWEQGIPLGRLGGADDVAGVMTFLASPAARYITGTTVVVDGGADAWGIGRPTPSKES